MSNIIENETHGLSGMNDSIGTTGSSSNDPDAEEPSVYVMPKPSPTNNMNGMNDDTSNGIEDDFNLIAESPGTEDYVKDAECDDNNVTNNIRFPSKARTSFTADSPYYSAFCEGEVNSLKILADTLYDISSRTKTFCRTGVLMSEATKRLALSCKLRSEECKNENDEGVDVNTDEEQSMIKRQAIGEEMAGILELLGQVSNNQVNVVLPK